MKHQIRLLFILVLFFSLIILIPSCGEKEKHEQEPTFSLGDTVMVKTETKKILGENLKFYLIGNFDDDSLQEVAAGIELTENSTWGIKFILLKVEGNHLIKKYESEILDGSFKESLVKKIKFPKYNYELIYYNSQDYFLGSGGGEVFAYIIDFGNKNKFYAHLFTESRRPVELFLSKNIADTDMKNFLISAFKKDYPDLRFASEDVSLEF